MGQLLLGFRSLIIKAAIFLIMAALLAWALGGTLFPRPHVAELRSRAALLGGEQPVFWSISIASRTQAHADWRLMMDRGGAPPVVPVDGRVWREGAGPVAGTDGHVMYGGCDEDGRWRVIRLSPDGSQTEHPVAGRLKVEQRLAQAAAGSDSAAWLDSVNDSADNTP